MTPEQWIKEHAAKLEQIAETAGKAIATVHAEQVNRIFVDGQRQNGKIGSYNSSSPLYVNPKYSPKKFTPKGKTGQTTFKNGSRHKTGFFNSYKAFRAAQGRQSSFVDFVLSGSLQSDYKNSLTRQGITWVTGTKNISNSRKLTGLLKKYGSDVFKLTQKEHDLLIRTAKAERLKLGI